MKTRLFALVLFVMVIMASRTVTVAQAFVNLDFEHPILPLDPNDPFGVPITNAMPGWTGYLGGAPVDRVFYNTVSIGVAAISLQGPASSSPLIQGNYSVILQGQFGSGGMSAAIGQTGQIPISAQSLIFLSGSESMQATFSGQPIPLSELGRTSSYLILGGDISFFAGQTGELRFTMPSVQFSFNIPYLDDIQFATQPIPEPGVFGLFAFGALLLGWGLRHKTR